MPRGARELYPNQYYHIIARSNNQIFILRDSKDFKYFYSLIKDYFAQNDVKCYHYVIMNTHAHFVVKLPEYIERIPDMMKMILWRYGVYYKHKYQYEGNLWRERYKSALIDTDRYMLGCGLYIEHNPVKAGMVKHAEDYVWSSYRHWIGVVKDPFLSQHPLEEVSRYAEIAEDYMEEYKDYVISTKIPIGRPRKFA